MPLAPIETQSPRTEPKQPSSFFLIGWKSTSRGWRVSLSWSARKFSGLGLSSTPLHWHFVLAAPPQYREILPQLVQALWSELYGNCKSEAYLAELPGMYYIASPRAKRASNGIRTILIGCTSRRRQISSANSRQATLFLIMSEIGLVQKPKQFGDRQPSPHPSTRRDDIAGRSLPTAQEQRKGGHHGRDW